MVRVADVNWPDVMGAIGGVVGVVAALGVGVPSVRAARRSARAAEDSSNEAKAVASLQRDQRHDGLRPQLPEVFYADLENDPHRPDNASLVGEFTLPRDYRVRALGVHGQSEWLVGFPNDGYPEEGLLRGRRPIAVRLKDVYPGQRAEMDEVRFRFWPPAPTDDVEHWTCPCGRPIDDGGRYDAPGHWEVRVRVDHYDVLDTVP